MQLHAVQLGVGVSGGCEAAAHVRAFFQSPVVPGNNVLDKLDMKKAFNTVRRYIFLEVCTSIDPSIHRLASTTYATSSHLVIVNETILSPTRQSAKPGPVRLGGRRNSQIGMEVISSLPDYLPTLSAAKTSTHSLLVKHHILAIDEAS